MPFDGTNFQQDPLPRRPTGPSDNLVTFMIVGIAATALLAPVPLICIMDIVRAFRGG